MIQEVNYTQLMFLLYFAGAAILLVFSLFISSPELLRMNSYKAYVTGIIVAVVIIAFIIIALVVIRDTIFTQPDRVMEPYQFFIGAVLALFPATVLGISMIRAK